MQTKIIDGRKIRDEILEDVKKDIADLSFVPVFCDVLVGDDVVSMQYVNMKKKRATALGMQFHDAHFPSSTTTEDLIMEIRKINNIPNMCGVIIQLPLPAHIDKRLVMNAIDPRLDVDCLGDIASKNFYEDRNDTGYPAALACITILDSLNLEIENLNIVVVGQGELVGKPVAHILERRGLMVTKITKATVDKEEMIRNADIVISAAGVGQFIDGSMIKDGAVVIDAGTSESDGGVVGDVNSDSVIGVASYLAPVPGGVGPVTIALLLKNILKVAQN